ncbi:MAG TPA: exodeoxyribonuclease III, partial [Actinomycetales bacterium]|nr:exodeoxyribonuclease III [Actinomycetales bacterium]
MVRVLSIATVNVNGIRAAFRRGMTTWLETRPVDIITLQEVRAPDEIVQEYFSDEWNVVHTEAEARGRAGVAIVTKLPLENVVIGCGDPYFDAAGRWAEADITAKSGKKITVVSAYVHSGEVGTPRQDDKYRFMDQMTVRLAELAASGKDVVITGDLNVGHTELDIKNWKGNIKNAGFLPEERAYFDRWLGDGTWVDVARALAGD